METSTIQDSDKLLQKIADEKGDEKLNSAESKMAVNHFLDLLKQDSGLLNSGGNGNSK